MLQHSFVEPISKENVPYSRGLMGGNKCDRGERGVKKGLTSFLVGSRGVVQLGGLVPVL